MVGNASFVLLPPEPTDEGVERRCEDEAEASHAEHPEQHRCLQRLPHLCSGSGCDGKRGNTQNERERGHQDRPKARPRSVHRGLARGGAFFFPLPGEFDDQDCILGRKTNQNNEADLRQEVDWCDGVVYLWFK